MVSLQVLPGFQLIFPSKTLFFWKLFGFSEPKTTISPTFWIQILPNKFHLILLIKIFPTTSKAHSNSSKKFQLRFNLIFSEEIHSIFKNFFYKASPNAMKPSWCTPPPWELSKETKNVIWSIPIWWISFIQKTKQNKMLPCFRREMLV